MCNHVNTKPWTFFSFHDTVENTGSGGNQLECCDCGERQIVDVQTKQAVWPKREDSHEMPQV